MNNEYDSVPCNLAVFKGDKRKRGDTYDKLLAMAYEISDSLTDEERSAILADPTTETLKDILQK